MRYSKLFGKTTYGEQKGSKMPGHQLLVRGGFIRESVAGRYFFLPLGMRVKNKIIDIIREEMDKSGAQEMVTPILHPLELWQETNRDNAGNFGLMTVEDRRGAKFALGGTAEEMFVDVVRKFQISYKDLPFNVYQFSQKFRDELRARGGLLRVREFTMKDAYSFDTDETAFAKTYQAMADTYSTIFDRLGLDARKVEADNGYIGGDYCHEYIVDCDQGESTYLMTEDGSYCAHEDVAAVVLNDMNPEEDIKEFEIFEQPKWVQKMEDNQKHHRQPAWRFLKNVVYKRSDNGEIIVVTIRGDLEVNKVKLESAIKAIELLEEATTEDLASFGTKPGYVHAWGHEGVTYVADKSLKTVRNFIGGQKEDETDSRNVNYGRDFTHPIEADVALAAEGMVTSEGKAMKAAIGVEVGNIFQLGTHYTDKMDNAVFADDDGKRKAFYMGCYGIGVGRTLATIAELYHDDRGLMWPAQIAPFSAYLISLKGAEDRGQDVYDALNKAGVEVLWDDRNESPGAKFADADLIGCPVRLVVSQKTNGNIEWKLRNESEQEIISLEEAIGRLTTVES